MSKVAWLILLGALLVQAQPPAPVPVFGWQAIDRGDGAVAALTPIAASQMALAPDGTLLYAETGRIRQIDSSGRIRTVVTDPDIDSFEFLALDGAGNLYYVNPGPPSSVVKAKSAGAPVPIAGGGMLVAAEGVKATDAQLVVEGLATGPGGVYFSDANTFSIYRVDAGGILRVVAGTGVEGTGGVGGQATSAQLDGPNRIAFDTQGNLFIGDSGMEFRWLRVDASGRLTSLPLPPQDIVAFSFTPDGSIFYSDRITNETYRRLPSGSIQPVEVRSGVGFEGCGTGPFAPQIFATPNSQVLSDSHGLLVLTGYLLLFRQKILRIDQAGAVTIVAGGPDEFSGDGGPASAAGLFDPTAVAADAAGNVFIGDWGNHRVRKVTPDGIIQTVAGTGPTLTTLYCTPPKDGFLSQIYGVAVDNAGVLYIADQSTNRVWRQDSDGQLTAFAGNGQSSTNGAVVGSKAAGVPLDGVGQIVFDKAQNLWIASSSNGLVKVGRSGLILDVVPLASPSSITADPSGTLYATTNERAYRIAPDDSLVPIAAIRETPKASIGPGPPGGVEYPVGIPPYGGPSSLTTTADDNGTVYFIATNSIETITTDCVRESANFNLNAYFVDSTIDPAGGIYLADESGLIWKMPVARTSGRTSISLGAAGVRSLGSGIVVQNPTGFGAGGDGMGITSYNFISDAIAPGELIRISGTCLGPRNRVEAKFNDAGELPVSLAGTQVFFEGTPAPLVSVVGGEIVAIAPYDLAGKSLTNMTVENAKGQALTMLNVAPAVPGLLHRIDPQGADSVVALNANGSLNSSATPAAVGSVVALFGTGLGQTKPTSRDGLKRTGLLTAKAEVKVEINGLPALVVFAGATPGLVGLDQINVQVPATSTGPVSVTAAGANRPSGVLWISQ